MNKSMLDELSRCCKSRLYGTILVGKLKKNRAIFCMSDGFYAKLRGCIFKVESVVITGKQYWEPVECVQIEEYSEIVGKKVILTLYPDNPDIKHTYKSTKGFMELWRDQGIIKELLDLDTCKVLSVYEQSTL